MHYIKCPWCGERNEAEFQYQGDANVKRPKADGSQKEFFEYVYIRDNPKGWHTEWWHHVGGCRQWVKVVRNTMTHEIYKTAKPNENIKTPKENK